MVLIQFGDRRIVCEHGKHFNIWDKDHRFHNGRVAPPECKLGYTPHVHLKGSVSEHNSTCSNWQGEHWHHWPQAMPYGKGGNPDADKSLSELAKEWMVSQGLKD